jgi:replicative DNA helicase
MTDQEPLRHVPYDIAVEQALLGSFFVDNRTIDVASADLDESHFYDPMHQRLFNMIVQLQTEGEVTPLIVSSCMQSDPGLAEVGGHAYLAGLAQAAPAFSNVSGYVRILRELTTRRALIRIGEDMVNAAYEPPHETSAQSIADGATEAILQAGRETGRVIVPAYDLALESLQEAEDIANGKPVPMIRTGLARVDNEIGGFRGGDLIVIAGKSGMGKSALMGSLGRSTALSGIPTIVFSLEMQRRQWIERMVCDIDFSTAEKAMWYSRVRNGRLSADEFGRFYAAAQKLHSLPFEIHDDGDLTIQQISSRARAFKAKHGHKLGLVILDYLQKVEPAQGRRDRSREQEVNAIAAGAKSTAKLLGWPLVAGSQLNEGDTTRSKDEQRPQAKDVRESKGILNEADMILLPYRPAYYVMKRKPMDALPGDPMHLAWQSELKACRNRMELIVGKNRHGRECDIELFCEMGANAVRDEAPMYLSPEREEVQKGLEFV